MQLETEVQCRVDAEAVAKKAQSTLKQHLLESVNQQRELEEQLQSQVIETTSKVRNRVDGKPSFVTCLATGFHCLERLRS